MVRVVCGIFGFDGAEEGFFGDAAVVNLAEAASGCETC